MSSRDFLLELGCEELPPKSLKTLSLALADGIRDGLAQAGLEHGIVHAYATPRRLAVRVDALAERQPDRSQTVDGPPVKAAFDAEGQPTAAALGFAKKNGVGIEALDRSGEKLRFVKHETGEATLRLLPGIVQTALDKLPIAKRMRWGSSRAEFVRPVQWLLMLFGREVVPAEILGQRANRLSHGHRFHHPHPLSIANPDQYYEVLELAYVIADFDTRRERIRRNVQALAAENGGRALMPDALLDEVTALVEWPVPLVCGFEDRFLDVPQEALISTMQDNQKYFCLVDEQGKLLPLFITVTNLASLDPLAVVEGNEKVVRPRLTDAEFFFHTDRKTPLTEHNERNRHIVFQAELGTVFDKTARLEKLAAFMARATGAPEKTARRAAQLAKADLCTQMVGEFPELQGIMGEYYARHDGEDEAVAIALREQYLPRFAGDALPQSPTGITLALADRIDTLAGLFAIGQPPTGSKDPFALRRAALGVLRILIEHRVPLALNTLVAEAVSNFAEQIKNNPDKLTELAPAEEKAIFVKRQHENTEKNLLDFLFGRYRALFEEQGLATEAILAVLGLQPQIPADVDARVRAVAAFLPQPEALALAAANKRVGNILNKEAVQADLNSPVQEALFTESAERDLFTALEALRTQVQPLLAERRYGEALQALAGLREPVDRFFTEVMVMAEDSTVKQNRLNLLGRFQALFRTVADWTLLVPEK